MTCILLGVLLKGCHSSLFTKPIVPLGGLNSQAPDESPAYSGNGRYLAFDSERNGRRDIYLFDLQQRRLVALPNLNRSDSSQSQPTLSQNGRYLAYVSTERGKTDILVYDRQQERSQLLTANVRGSVSHPTISGDGRQVAFQTSEGGQWNIAIIKR